MGFHYVGAQDYFAEIAPGDPRDIGDRVEMPLQSALNA
jgi:hypothetical protein